MYAYICAHYAFQPVVGRRVRHLETLELGTIGRENHTHGHYVRVAFDHMNRRRPALKRQTIVYAFAHPGALEYVDIPPPAETFTL